MSFTPYEKAVLTCGDVLCRADGSRRLRADAVEQFGDRATTWAEIYEMLAERAAHPPRLSVPRRIFVSYRWGTDAQNRWVEELFEKLRKRGNEVVFDRDVARDLPEVSIVSLVSRIADCSMFLMVVDPGYIERVCTDDPKSKYRRSAGWAWDEFALWRHLVDEVRLPGIGLLREGTEVPRHMTLAIDGELGGVVDVRAEGELDRALAMVFRPIAPAPEPEIGRQAAWLLYQSGIESRRGDYARASQIAQSAAALIPELPDGHARLATTSLILGRNADAHAAATRALTIDDQSMLFYYLAAAAACANGEYAAAVQTVAPLTSTNATKWRPHLIIAHALAEVGQLGSARAHRDLAFDHHTELRKALTILHHATDFDRPDAVAMARAMFDVRSELRIVEPFIRPTEQGFFTTYLEPPPELPQRANAIDIDLALLVCAARSDALMRLDQHPDEWHITCTSCRIGIRIEEEFLCMLCGAQYGGNLQPCRYCGNSVLLSSQMVAYGARLHCPFCHSGILDPGNWAL